MKLLNFIFLASIFLIDYVMSDIPVAQCDGYSFEDLRNRIQVSMCGKSRCKLKKGTDVNVTFKFKPTTTVETLKNEVHAVIVGVPLPFIGVTGTDACSNVKNADDGLPAPCPLAPNKEYIYTNVIRVEQFYPEVNLIVHWALRQGSKDVICFEVPAVITASSKKG